VGRELELHEAIEHFTLDEAEVALLRNKSGATRLGFAALLKFLMWTGRFPRGRFEIPIEAIGHLAKQVGVAPDQIGSYDFTGRTIKGHRKEIRDHTGFHPCTVSDAQKLADWLAGHIAQEERRAEHIRGLLLAHCKDALIEPPTPDRTALIVDNGIRQADDLLVAVVLGRLGDRQRSGIGALVAAAADDGLDAAEPHEAGGAPLDVDLLALIKSSPGNVSLATMNKEIDKLEAVRAIGLPAALFAGISPKVVTAWRARAAVESPSHLRRHGEATRVVLLAALLHQREREITDTLVDLLNSTVHKINAGAEKRVTEAFAKQYKAVRNKDAMLPKVAEASQSRPAGQVKTVIYPVLGGEQGIADLLAEYKAHAGGFERDKRMVFHSSYTGHYRSGLIRLLC